MAQLSIAKNTDAVIDRPRRQENDAGIRNVSPIQGRG